MSRQRCSQVSELVQCGESRDKVKCVLSNGTDDNVLGREWEILTKIQNNTGTVDSNTVTHTKVKCVLSNGPEDNVPAGHERMQNNI